MKQFLFYFLAISALIHSINAQGGYPPRLNIPGAVAVPSALGRPQFRNEKLVRVRRPVALRAQNAGPPQRIIEETKPVTEAPEEEDNVPDAFLPSLLREQQLAQAQQAQFHQQAAAFLHNEQNIDTPSPLQLLHEEEPILLPTLPRFPERPQPISSNSRPNFNDYGIGSSISGSRFERPQGAPATTAAVQQLPPQQHQQPLRRTRPNRPQYEAQVGPAPTAAPQQRPRPKPIQPRPSFETNQIQQQYHNEERRKRPVAQTIRKWRDENEDGTITWGYENDDGSFKEEIIGTDCVTKGTYGYVDPDGNKREYQYETGIKCDPNARDQEEELPENGYINYEENKAILPNGIEVDMSQLGKNHKSRRPGAQLRNY